MKRKLPLVVEYSEYSNCILFCGRDKESYPWMSNFYCCNSIIDKFGHRWRSVEHAYQAMKFKDRALQEEIRKTKTPKEAKVLANRILREHIREDWHDIKLNIMRKLVRMKFQNPILMEKLKSTKSKKLIEHASWDNFWGSGPDMKGQNWMGRILMEIRDE